jgi:hypothetical protein
MDIRKIDSEVAFASVAALNSTRRGITSLLTTKAHAGATSVVNTGNWQAPAFSRSPYGRRRTPWVYCGPFSHPR